MATLTSALPLKEAASTLALERQNGEPNPPRNNATVSRASAIPIQQIPTELLSEIFLFLLTSRDIDIDWDETLHDALKDLLHICQVCRHWRQVAQKTRLLWTAPYGIYTGAAPGVDLIADTKFWLERSAPNPICITTQPRFGALYDIEPLTKLLLGAASRWYNMHLQDDFVTMLAQLGPADTLQNIEEVSLFRPRTVDHDTVTAFLSAPRLRRVQLRISDFGQFPMPWAQLTALSLNNLWGTSPWPQTCVDILVQCTSLVSAALTMHAKRNRPVAPRAGVVTLQRLERLSIYVFSGHPQHDEHFMHFFEGLELPALAALDMILDPELIWDTSVFTPFQSRCPNVATLTIDTCSLTSSDLVALLRNSPSLTYLGMDHCMRCIDDEFFNAFEYSPLPVDAVHLAPKLFVMELTVVGANFSDAVMKKAILSRRWTRKQLAALPSPPAVAGLGSVLIQTGEYESADDFSLEK
jgi:hypothetical protein